MSGFVLVAWIALAIADEVPRTPDVLCSIDSAERVIIAPDDAHCRTLASDSDPVPPEIIRFARLSATGVLLFGSRTQATAQAQTFRVLFSVPKDVAEMALQIEPTNGSADNNWSIRLRSADLARIKKLTVPRGTYRLVASAAHCRPMTRMLVATGSQEIRIELLPPFVIRGTVLDIKSLQPIAAAQVRTEHGERTVTDRDGRFALEILEEWPNTLAAEATGYSSAIVRTANLQGQGQLPPIILGRGTTVEVDVIRDGSDDIALELRRRDGATLIPTRTKVLHAGEDHVDFTLVAPGRYRLYAKGKQPLERFGVDVDVQEGQIVFHTLLLQRASLHLATTRGGKTLGDVQVRVRHTEGHWEETVTIDNTGTLNTPFWQGGELNAMVLLPVGHFSAERQLTNEDTSWKIDLPDTTLTLIVTDAETGNPIPNAMLITERGPAGLKAIDTTRCDEAGRAIIDGVAPGELVVRGMAPRYLQTSTVVNIGKGEKREARLSLQRAAWVELQVINAVGAPVANADAISSTAEIHSRTNGNGFCALTLPPGKSALVFIVPPDASFALTHVEGRDTDAPAVVSVPAGLVNVIVRVLTDDEAPVPGISLRVRYNGYMLPDDVMDALASQHRRRLVTDSFGVLTLKGLPVGTYELWPILNGLPLSTKTGSLAGAPITVAAQPGNNIVNVTVRDPRRKNE